LKVRDESGIFVSVNRNAVRWVLVLGIISIIGILSVQVFFIRKALTQEDRQLNQTITIALGRVAEKLALYNDAELPQVSPVLRHSPDYYIVNVNGEINPDILEQFLITEFQARNLKEDFEYGIYDCRTDAMVYGRLIQFGENEKIRPMETEFPKHTGYLYYFGIHFVGRAQTLANSMGIWYFFSLILILVVAFFVYSQWIILRQRRYAEVQRDFINTMTHEFKTPLASLSMAAEVIRKPGIENEPDRLKKYGQIITSQVSHLLGQIERVLELGGRNVEKKMYLNPEKVDLEILLIEVLNPLEPRIRCDHGTLDFRYSSKVRYITADRVHLTNVFLNILDNSIKYSGQNPKISVEVSDNDSGLQLVFSDQGTGIPSKYARQVFDRFFRVPTGNVQSVKGFGLGLYYVRNVVKAHRWNVRFDVSVTEGTRLVISIPKKRI
jgi:two-component system phosphate regulon sensor histidine kinase PhoR